MLSRKITNLHTKQQEIKHTRTAEKLYVIILNESPTNVAKLVFALGSAADVTDGTNVLLFKAEFVIVHRDSVSIKVKLQRRHNSRIRPDSHTAPMLHVCITSSIYTRYGIIS